VVLVDRPSGLPGGHFYPARLILNFFRIADVYLSGLFPSRRCKMSINQSANNDQPCEIDAQSIDIAAFWQRFITEFPSTESCIDELYRRAGAKLLTCHHCFQPLIPKKSGARVIHCSSCKNDTCPTAGTFFDRMRRPRSWLAIIWFSEQGVTINGWQLHELSGIASSSAANLLSKFATVMRGVLPDDATEIPSELFCSIFAKRSRETPAGKHPRAEEEAVQAAQRAEQATGNSGIGEESPRLPSAASAASQSPSDFCGNPDNIAAQTAPATDEQALENAEQRKIYSMLCEQPIHFDLLCNQTGLPEGTLSGELTLLELNGLVERLNGDCYLRKAKEPSNNELQAGKMASVSEQTAAKVSEIIGFIKVTWRGISRKYLQNYLGVFCFIRCDKAGGSVVSLLDACLQSGPISYEETLAYVTPALVNLW
jgi:DprA winged helix domain